MPWVPVTSRARASAKSRMQSLLAIHRFQGARRTSERALASCTCCITNSAAPEVGTFVLPMAKPEAEASARASSAMRFQSIPEIKSAVQRLSLAWVWVAPSLIGERIIAIRVRVPSLHASPEFICPAPNHGEDARSLMPPKTPETKAQFVRVAPPERPFRFVSGETMDDLPVVF